MDKDPTIGELADAVFRIREARQKLNKKEADLKKRQNYVEELLMAALDAQNTRKGEGSLASCSVNTSIVPTITDWHKVDNWMLRHKDLSLFERRLKVTRYRELLEELPKGVPGVEPFEKRTLSITKVSK